MNFIESIVDVEYYVEKADIQYLTRLEVQHVIEFFEMVSESVSEAVITLDLDTAECIEDVTKLLWAFKELQATLPVC